MYETLCFLLQSSSPNLDDLFLRCDGCETVSCVVGSVPHYAWGFKLFFVHARSTEFHCDL